MRFSRILQVSCVSTLVMSPVMAQEAADVHEQALRILREQSAQSSPATPAPKANPAPVQAQTPAAESRADRQHRLRLEAEARKILREQQQEQRRREFEEQKKARELLLQQRDASPTASPASPVSAPANIQDVHQQALEILRGETPPAAIPAQAAPAAPVAPAAPIAPPATQSSTIEAAPVSPQPTFEPRSPRPTKETEERVREILNDRGTRPSSSATPPATVDEDDAYAKELEQRARQALIDAQPSTSVAPAAPVATQPAPREDERRATEERARQILRENAAQNTPATTAQPANTSPVRTLPPQRSVEQVHEQALQILRNGEAAQFQPVQPSAAEPVRRQQPEFARTVTPPQVARRTQSTLSNQQTLSPELEQKAREILHQEQGLSTAAPSAVAPAPASTAPAPVVSESYRPAPSRAAQTDALYSRELEDRARQTLIDRSQAQAPAGQPSVSQSSAAPSRPLTEAESAAIHNQAYQALREAEATAAGPRTKRQKLHDITELYKADRMTPAEYHQRRAKILAEP